MTTDSEEVGEVKTPSIVIDFKVPLTALAGAAIFVAGALITMYFQLASVTEAVRDLKLDVKASHLQAQEQGVMKYRLDKLEAEMKGK